MAYPLPRLRAWVRNCDPARPLDPDDPLYVDLDAGEPVRGSDHHAGVQQLAHTIRLAEPMAETCQLFSGFPGSGKTTELRRLARELAGDADAPTHVLIVDFEAWIDLYAPIAITDVLRVLAYVLDREATLLEGRDPNRGVGYLERLRNFLASASIKEVGWEDGVTLLFEFRDNPSFRQRVEEVMQNRFQQFAREAEQVMSEAVVRIRAATGRERVVVLVDSLEKLTALRDEDRGGIEASVEKLFFVHANLLRLPCHVVYTFPFWLSFRRAALGTSYSFDPVLLPMVKVAEIDGQPFPPGLAKMREMVHRRVDLPAVFGTVEALEPFLVASGGYPRELLRMVRELLVQADELPVPAGDVTRVIERLTEDYAAVVRSTDLDVLGVVGRTRALPVGDHEDIAVFTRLVNGRLILAYRNGRRWYDLHPLVRRLTAVSERIDTP